MAKQLDKFKWTRSKYPWDAWTNGEIWEIRRGDDFESETTSMVPQLHEYGRRNGFKVKTRTLKGEGSPDTIVFQYIQYMDTMGEPPNWDF